MNSFLARFLFLQVTVEAIVFLIGKLEQSFILFTVLQERILYFGFTHQFPQSRILYLSLWHHLVFEIAGASLIP